MGAANGVDVKITWIPVDMSPKLATATRQEPNQIWLLEVTQQVAEADLCYLSMIW